MPQKVSVVIVAVLAASVATAVLPNERIESGDFPWQDLRPRFFEGFHRCIPALAHAGNNLIVEHIVETEAWMHRLLRLFSRLDVFFVGVHCPLAELERRELERGNRRLGEARADFETAHAFAEYDFEVVSTRPLDENVKALTVAWKSRQRPSAFEKMEQRGEKV